MGHRAPWTQAILDVLADNQWHTRQELLAAGAALVPPGKAYRAGEWARRQRRRRANQPDQARLRGGNQAAIDAGGRLLAANVLHHLHQTRVVIRDDADRYRLAIATGRAS